jgi:hypothetical protein
MCPVSPLVYWGNQLLLKNRKPSFKHLPVDPGFTLIPCAGSQDSNNFLKKEKTKKKRTKEKGKERKEKEKKENRTF